MAIARENKSDQSEGKLWNLCRMPFWHNNANANASAASSGGGGTISGGPSAGGSAAGSGASSSSSLVHHPIGGGSHHYSHMGSHVTNLEGPAKRQANNTSSITTVARSLIPASARRRLRLDPASKMYFPYEPGKQVRSAIRIKNTSKAHIAFKFQTTAPKSCFMRPPGAILSPGESLIATVFKFVEHPENNENLLQQKCKVKFKILSLKVKGPMDYAPELFDEQKDQVVVERVLRVVFLDVDHPSPQLEKLKTQLAEADAALETRKKPAEDNGPKIVGEGLVIDEWKERRERYLARQQVEVVDSV
ncbi:Vesicle-associated protein 4-2 [Rhynchospora pubera]|uniref:Vesicle-associated protein 4-2 n=1 Tax=Rhynchospora pubera TaxID=906938 RepID=A0AAV8BSQ6_9POAL|nr:Vesicle-associated protein 4-2 [Rhynchospora pubera]